MGEAEKNMEALNVSLNNPKAREEYKKLYDAYKASFLPRVLAGFLVGCGNFVYGRAPSYLKFRAIEVIARVPYHSWESAAYTLLTIFYRDEKRAMRLSKLAYFSRLAKDNETMHVVVISQFADGEEKSNFLAHTFIPLVFAFGYFWTAYWLYLWNHRSALEFNFLFESHAYQQYDQFLNENEKALRGKSAQSEYLSWYGRTPGNQYEFFQSVRNDELIHRNESIRQIEEKD
jgi:hypothetical protein